jgi:hypothetical protein
VGILDWSLLDDWMAKYSYDFPYLGRPNGLQTINGYALMKEDDPETECVEWFWASA